MTSSDWRDALAQAVEHGLAAAGPTEVGDALAAHLGELATHPDAPIEPLRPDHPVLGVDACPSGWVGVLLGPEGRATVHVASSIKGLIEQVRETASPVVVAVDIPIGLPDSGSRQADALARKALPGKGSSVFTTLTRAAYASSSYAEGREANLVATNGESSASAQAYALGKKILDVDAWVRSDPGAVVIEVHPELCFARMAGTPVLEKKKDPAGVSIRRELLDRAGLVAPGWFSGSGFAEDDLLDACAAAWSAARRLEGSAESLPEVPEKFSDGIPAAIWV